MGAQPRALGTWEARAARGRSGRQAWGRLRRRVAANSTLVSLLRPDSQQDPASQTNLTTKPKTSSTKSATRGARGFQEPDPVSAPPAEPTRWASPQRGFNEHPRPRGGPRGRARESRLPRGPGRSSAGRVCRYRISPCVSHARPAETTSLTNARTWAAHRRVSGSAPEAGAQLRVTQSTRGRVNSAEPSAAPPLVHAQRYR